MFKALIPLGRAVKVITPSTTGQRAIQKLKVNWRKRKIGGKGDGDIAGEQHSGEIDS
jgi:hypothetical protein